VCGETAGTDAADNDTRVPALVEVASYQVRKSTGAFSASADDVDWLS
jgi:hypothetical protein